MIYQINHYMFKFILFVTFISIITSTEVLIIGSDSICFNNFCCNGECSSKMLNPILDLAFPNTTFVWSNRLNPNIVVRSPFREKDKKPYNCPYINLSGEPYRIDQKEYPPILEINTFIDYELQREKNGIKTNFYIPHIINSNYDPYNVRKYNHLNRPYLIAYMNSNCQNHREYMFKLLVKRFKRSIEFLSNDKVEKYYPSREAEKYSFFSENEIHALGYCSNNRKNSKSETWANAYDIYKDYIFTFAMENTDLFGYITEKIMNAYIAGSIPIYWGSQGKIKDFFNPESYINVNDFNSFDDCVEYIYNLYYDKPRLKKMQTASVFINNTIPDVLLLNNNALKDVAYHLRKNYYNAIKK